MERQDLMLPIAIFVIGLVAAVHFALDGDYLYAGLFCLIAAVGCWEFFSARRFNADAEKLEAE